MLKGCIALGLGLGAVLFPGSAAQAQETLPLLEGIQVSPAVLTRHGEVSVSVPGFENAFGCKFGTILAGSSINESRALLNGDFDVPRTYAAVGFVDGPFVAGTYSIFVRCRDETGGGAEYRTDQTLRIENSATTTTPAPSTTLATTTTMPPSVNGSVDPTTAVPGETTVTIRGGGFKPKTALTITLAGKPPTALGTTESDAAGFYWTTLQLPRNTPPGNQQVVVAGPAPDDSARTTTAGLVVTDLDCADFPSNDAAQAAMASGGRDPHGLDGNRDGVACNGVSARRATGGSTPAPADGTLPQTGSERSEIGVMVGLGALTLGALFVGLSHPAVPASGHHRRRRRGWRH